MRRRWLIAGLASLAIAASAGIEVLIVAANVDGSDGMPAARAGDRSRFSDSAGSTTTAGALRFDANVGQFDDGVAFAARGPGYSVFLTPEGATLALQRGRELGAKVQPAATGEPAVIRMRVVGGRPVKPSGSEELPGSSNYFVGNDRSRWREGVKGCGRVLYPSVRPGLDVVFYGRGQTALEYDLILAPGTDPSQVALQFEGAQAIDLDSNGDLLLRTASGNVRQPAPVAYQRSADGERTLVTARYAIRRDGAIAFAVGPHNPDRHLVIDPTIVYSTYLGGANDDLGFGIAVDSAGAVYLTGYTFSTNFPVASAAQSTFGGQFDAFVTKLSPTGSIVYSSYLGGAGADRAAHIAIDSVGSDYVTGTTTSSDFPIVAAAQPTYRGNGDGFVTKLSPTGAIVYSTFLGGSDPDFSMSIAVDGAGAAYVVGFTDSVDFPTLSALQPVAPGGQNGFVTKLSATGAFAYSTYLGGSDLDQALGVAVEASGSTYIAGFTQSINFPTMSPLQGALLGPADAFVTKLSPGGALAYSSYIGGSGSDFALDVAVDATGAAYLTGSTGSVDFPTALAFQPTKGVGTDAFVTKLNANGGSLGYSTFLGGDSGDTGAGIAVDSFGSAHVVGITGSTNFPLRQPLQVPALGGVNAFVSKLGNSGLLVYSTYLEGTNDDYARGIAVDSSDFAYVVGQTSSIGFPTNMPLQGSLAGGADAFVTKLSPSPSPPITLPVPAMAHLTAVALALLLAAVATRLLPTGRPPRIMGKGSTRNS